MKDKIIYTVIITIISLLIIAVGYIIRKIDMGV